MLSPPLADVEPVVAEAIPGNVEALETAAVTPVVLGILQQASAPAVAPTPAPAWPLQQQPTPHSATRPPSQLSHPPPTARYAPSHPPPSQCYVPGAPQPPPLLQPSRSGSLPPPPGTPLAAASDTPPPTFALPKLKLSSGAHLMLGSSSNPPSLGGGSGRNLAERKDWSEEEDAQICESVEKHGFKWRLVAADVPGRSDDAVRNRWNRIKPSEWEGGSKAKASHCKTRTSADAGEKDRVSWSRAEDELIVRSVSELGNKWAKIAERLHGRTEHAIRNRYARLQSLASRGNPIVLTGGKGLPIGIQLVPEGTQAHAMPAPALPEP